MNILLIGHRGYLGTGLHAYFRPRHRVVGWDVQEDLFQLSSRILAEKNIELVVNLAVAADRKSPHFREGELTERINVGGARHLAAILKGTQIPWIQMSTREVLGPIYREIDVTRDAAGYHPKFLVAEDAPYAPANFYGKSKIVAEFISESHPFSNVIRLTTCYTDFDHPAGNWVVSLAKSAVQKRPVTLTQGGWQFRDPLHVDDLGRLMEKLVETKVCLEKIHAGGGEANLISLREFVQRVDPQVTIQEAPGGDFGFAFANAKATRLTGWVPEVSVRDRIPVLADNIRRGVTGQESD
jgi:nucleoside-diphosphate-sugar epimerase